MAEVRSTPLDGIQIARALAAVLVVFLHALEEASFSPAGTAPDWLFIGGAGVDIFFVISGFIMMVVSFPAARPAEQPGVFLRKRIARIYPLYWLCCAIVLIAAAQGFYRAGGWTADDIVRSLLLAPSERKLIFVSWTLVHEMNFYLLFAAAVVFRSPTVALGGVTAAIIVQLALAPFMPDAATREVLGDAIALEFCFGMALGWLFINGRMMRIPLWCIAPAGAFLFVAKLIAPGEMRGEVSEVWRALVWGAPAIVIVAAAATWRGGGRISNVLVAIGDASYAIYLLHPFVMLAYAKVLRAIPMLGAGRQEIAVFAVILASIAIGMLTHRTVERALSGAARKLLLPGRRRAVSAAAAT